MKQKQSILIAVTLILLVFVGVYLYQISFPENKNIRIIWERNGGFIGLNEDMTIDSVGNIIYTSDKFGNAQIRIPDAEVNEIIDAINLVKEETYAANVNMNDFFMYKLSVVSGSNEKIIQWVDEWASEEIPAELIYLQFLILNVIDKVHQEISKLNNSSELAVNIAQNFLFHASTFKFDGLPESVVVEGIILIESNPSQYVVTISFDSAHSGYGNRSEQVLAQVITKHTAIITVVNDNVGSASIDDLWNEITQEEFVKPLQQGFISGTVEIGPLCPVEPCSNPIDDIYSSREIVLTPEIGNIIRIKISSNGYFQAKVNSGIYEVNITDCDFLGCSNSLPITVKIENNLTLNLNISIDTGIR